MNYYIWEFNEKRKEIIFNKSENKMDKMEALTEAEFNEYLKQYPDYKLDDLGLVMIPVISHLSKKQPQEDSGLINQLLKGF